MTPAPVLSLAAAVTRPWDAIVVGAGPAGALAARQMARGGARTLLVERKAFPRHKVCGACLNGHALSTLAEVGLGDLPASLGAVSLQELRLATRGACARLRLTMGVAISRELFDAALVQAAIEAGAGFLPETTAHVEESCESARSVVLQHEGDTGQIAAAVVLAADGLGHGCLSWLPQFDRTARDGSRIGAGCGGTLHSEAYEPGVIFMAVGRSGYAGLVRVEGGRLNIAAALDRQYVRHTGGIGPAVEEIIRQAGFPEITGLGMNDWHGTAALTRRSGRTAVRRLLLLGDAAGYVEPFTGEGIAWALASGASVARTALRGISGWSSGLETEWTMAHDQIVGRRQRLCRLIAAGLRNRWMIGGAVRLLEQMPTMATPILRRLNAPALTGTPPG